MYSTVFRCLVVVLLFFFLALLYKHYYSLHKTTSSYEQWLCNKAKKPVRRQADTEGQWNISQVSPFNSFHRRKN